MPFELPNLADAAYPPYQARVFSVDWSILGAAAGGFNGVISGGEVTEAGSPAMTVDVASGRAKFTGSPVDFSADTVIITTADGTNPRIDLITVDDNGDIQLHTGTAAAAPLPNNPAAIALGTEVGLALVFVPPSDTAILQNQISDRRITVAEPLGASQWTTITAPSDVDRSLTTVTSIDPALQFSMSANTTYRVRGDFFWHSNPTGAAGGATTGKIGFGGPASPTLLALIFYGWSTQWGSTIAGIGGTTRGYNSYETTGLQGIALGGAASPALGTIGHTTIEGIIQNGSNSGTFGVYWAPATSIANVFRRMKGSWLEYEVV